MTTSNSSFLLGIKVLGLTAIVAILFSSSSANVAVTIQTSYAQSSTTSAGPTMTPPLAQNTTTSNPVDEGVIINSLVFEPDSSGWLRVDNNGTVGPIIPFTHNFTEANGYTIYASVPFYANNGSIVDLNSIDFSSQIITDPSANMTLPEKPRLSPAVTPGISSLPPPPSSQIETSPPQTTTTTPPSTPPSSPPSTSSSTSQGVVIDRQTAAQLAAQDPAFANFDSVMTTCFDQAMTPESTAHRVTYEQCAKTAQEAADRWCGLEFYDALKCEYASRLAENYKKIAGILGPGGSDTFEKLFGSGGLLN